MSSELTLFSQGNTALPANLSQFAGIFGAVDDAAAVGLGGESHPRITFKGSRFNLLKPGMEPMVLFQPHIDVAVVAANKYISKSFYATGYDPSDAGAPDCSSDNGVGPDTWVKSPQCATCAACPQNIFGSKVTDQGKEAKACQDRKRIAVVMASDPTTIYGVTLAYQAFKNFTQYGQMLKKGGAPLPAVVTRISFDTNITVPVVKFDAVGYVPEAFLPKIAELAASEEAQLCVGGTATYVAPAIAAPAQAQPQTNFAPSPSASTTGFAPSAPQPATTGFGAPQNVAPQEEPKRRGRPAAKAAENLPPAPHNPPAAPSFSGFGMQEQYVQEPSGFSGTVASAAHAGPVPDPALSAVLDNAFLGKF